MPTIPTIRCPKCKGRRRIRLPQTYQHILAILKKLKLATAPEVAAEDGEFKGLSNTNNKLEQLRKMGLAKRKRKNPTTWNYYPV